MNERNAEIQKMLKAEGLYKGKIDGIIGPVTRRALELHNKQQYQPLPRQHPDQIPMEAVAGPAGGPGAEATLPLEEASETAPDNELAEINSPQMGPATPASGEWVRAGLNALFGPETIQPPPQQPSYQPNFAGAVDYPPDFNRAFTEGPVPADSGALQQAIRATLGQLLSSAVPRR